MTPPRFPALLLALSLGLSFPASAQTPLSARSKGADTAPVTVYEMSDFQCPFCRRHALETFPTIDREYIQTGKVKWVFINFPLTSIHPNAVAAAEFAMCSARQGKFWAAHDLLFANQETWAPIRNPGPYLISLADTLKLNRATLTRCLEGGETRNEVQQDAQGALRAGAGSTPTFWIEGGMMTGAYPIGVFRQVLDSIYAAKRAKG